MSSTQTMRGPNRASMIYTDDPSGLTFEWSGGAYIDVDGFDCISVWDYESDTPSIPATLTAFEARCVEYVTEGDR